MLSQTITVGTGEDAVEVTFKASAALVRLYMAKMHRDLIKDFAKLQKALAKTSTPSEDDTDSVNVSVDDVSTDILMLFEDIAYVMAYHACNDEEKKSFPQNPDDWLEQFSTFSIYEILPVIMELWHMNNATASVSKKK